MEFIQDKEKERRTCEGTGDDLIFDEFTEHTANLLLRFMKKLKNSASNIDPVKGYSILLGELTAARMLDDAILKIEGDCPDCGYQMDYIGRYSVQLFVTAIFLLVKQRMVTPKSITLPTLEMITKELEKGYLQMMAMKCQACGSEIITMPLTNLEYGRRYKTSS